MANPFADFINLFTPPDVVQQMQDQAAQQETFRALEGLIGGPQPFQQDLFPGEAPIPGLQTITEPGTPTDIIRTLLQSKSSGLAQQGLQGLQGLAQARQQRDLAAKGLSRLTSREDATPAQRILSDVVMSGTPFAQDAFKSLVKTLEPTTISSGQTRLGAFGQALATGQIDQSKKREVEDKTRGEYLRLTERFAVVDESMSSIKRLAEAKSTPATDNSLLFMYARILSPGIVTEEDFNNAKRSGGAGLPGQARIFFQQMQNGLLPDSARKNIANAAAVQYLGQRDIFNKTRDYYKTLAKLNSLDPNAVVGTRKAETNIDDLLNLSAPAFTPPPPPGFSE